MGGSGCQSGESGMVERGKEKLSDEGDWGECDWLKGLLISLLGNVVAKSSAIVGSSELELEISIKAE